MSRPMTAAEMGRKGGKRCLETMTPEQRVARGKRAARIRWAKKKKNKG